MPGMMSKIFDSDEQEDSSSQTTSIEGEGETGLEASPEITLTMGGSHQNADGSSTEWSNETHVGTEVDVDAAAASALSLSSIESDQAE